MSETQTNYFRIYLILLAALVVSLILGALSSSALTVTIIFVIAGIKAYLVLNHFVHLEAEPRYIKVAVVGFVAILVVLYVGLVPDIVWIYGKPEVIP